MSAAAGTVPGMGLHLYGLDAADWTSADEGGWRAVASGVNGALARAGLPPYGPGDGPGWAFEEKLGRPMAGFTALCEAHLPAAEQAALGGWTVMVPVPPAGEVRLPFATAYDDTAEVVAAARVLAAAERLAAVLELPAELPDPHGPLVLTCWFLDGGAQRLAARSTAPWSTDLDAAFHVALYLRAAQYALRHGRPVAYC